MVSYRVFFGTLMSGAVIASSAAFSATLTVTVDGLASTDGSVMMAVNANEAQYDGAEKPAAVAQIAPNGDSVSATFKDLTPGTYAVRVFHDLDGDGQIKTNFLGIPSEPWGLSNNPAGSFGPPKWTDAAFDLSEDGTSISISLNK